MYDTIGFRKVLFLQAVQNKRSKEASSLMKASHRSLANTAPSLWSRDADVIVKQVQEGITKHHGEKAESESATDRDC